MAIRIEENVMLAPLTTFQIGGSARYFVKVCTEEEVCEAVSWAYDHGYVFLILSGGSNVLIPDEGFDGLVIHVAGDDFSVTDSVLDCNAGCNLLQLIRDMADCGLGGWEKMAGIPGSIGGGVRGGIGAFGSEIKDFITEVRVLNSETGSAKVFSNTECNFSYRNSFFKGCSEWIILRVCVQLRKVDPSESHNIINETIVAREKKHLQSAQTAGSFFMNPTASEDIRRMFEEEKGTASREGRVPAGWLIEKTGMKGVTVGGAQVSLQHSNYILNIGHATAHDVRLLAGQVKVAVKEKFGVDLQEEVRVILP